MTPGAVADGADPRRPHRAVSVLIEGAVQGVGFRPFVYRLARAENIAGWVRNNARGVEIAASGEEAALGRFLDALRNEAPPHAVIRSLEVRELAGALSGPFEIRASDPGGVATATILPDLATCDACLAEVLDPADRRHLYPFTNCTHCGPRFSIIESLPYDRPNTTMKSFAMCDACRAEYEDPGDRRFHAQPNACPACGPALELHDRDGRVLARRHEALLAAAAAIREGRIVALKGIGGYQLVCDARSGHAVETLRLRKHREEKPFAVMFPSLDAVLDHAEADELEREALGPPEAPIVLLVRRAGAGLAAAVAPGNPRIGAMLPTTALHHVLLGELGFPVVATSGNLSDEPIATDDADARERLGAVADLFLAHDRPIARHVDDSVVRVIEGEVTVLRRARGHAPFPVALAAEGPVILATGGHLKNTVALASGRDAFLSQHIGDLGSAGALAAFRRAAADLPRLYRATPALVAADAHPDYLSTKYAAGLGVPVHLVQHHHAHVAACMAEHHLEGPVLGIAWDGTGWGPDGTVWGGEFLVATPGEYRRIAHLRTFAIAGGDAAMRQPRRPALGLLVERLGGGLLAREDLATVAAFTPLELNALVPLLLRREPSPGIVRTSSVGRLFDAVASILGLRQRASYEGQAAMELEHLAGPPEEAAPDPYPLPLLPGRSRDDPHLLDWAPLLDALLADLAEGVPAAAIAARFHESLAAAALAVALLAGLGDVVLSGGCFQNARLAARVGAHLSTRGFRVWRHRLVPPNDGGIALGQLASARARFAPARA